MKSINLPASAPRRTSALFAILLPVFIRSNKSKRACSSACSFNTMPRIERLLIFLWRDSGRSENLKPDNAVRLCNSPKKINGMGSPIISDSMKRDLRSGSQVYFR